MTRCSNIIAACAAFICFIGSQSCTKTTEQTKVLTHKITVSWFRDSTTPAPAAFLDLYNGMAYTPAQAADHEQSIDAFCFYSQGLPQVNLVSMNSFGSGNYAARYSFNAVVGVLPFKNYIISSFAPATGLSRAEYGGIKYNNDITAFFNANKYGDGTTNMPISFNNRDTNQYYLFHCYGNNKRGFFRLVSTDSLATKMTIEVKVEQ
jgi:hypothetical protein